MGNTELGIEGEGHIPANVVRRRPEGRPSSGTIEHRTSAGPTASVSVDEAGAFVLRIDGPEGHFQQEDAEGPRPRKLAPLLMPLAARGFFREDHHAEAIAVLYGVLVAALETEGTLRAGRVMAILAPALESP